MGRVDVGPQDTGLQVIFARRALSTPPKKKEHPDMGVDSSSLVLGECEFDILEPAVGECADEGVEHTSPADGGPLACRQSRSLSMAKRP